MREDRAVASNEPNMDGAPRGGLIRPGRLVLIASDVHELEIVLAIRTAAAPRDLVVDVDASPVGEWVQAERTDAVLPLVERPLVPREEPSPRRHWLSTAFDTAALVHRDRIFEAGPDDRASVDVNDQAPRLAGAHELVKPGSHLER